MKKPDRPSGTPPPRASTGEDEIQRRFPNVYAHLADETWDDGTARVTSTLFVFMEGYRWKCMFKDRAAGLVAFLTADQLLDLFELAERHLVSGTLDWKHDRKPTGRGR